MHFIFMEKLYLSRSELVIHLLKERKYNKSTIATMADVSPTTVEYLYKKLVKRKEIEDYYSTFIKLRKENRLKRKNKNII